MPAASLLAAYTLWRRELVRFLREPARVGTAVATPLVFWVLIGSGFSGSFRLPGLEDGVDYLAWFFPGTVVLLVLFAAIFSNMAVIEDRHEGFLQGVLVAPVGRWAVVAGKVAGGATLAWAQGLVILVLAPVAGLEVTAAGLAEAAGVLALLAVALTALGFALAWKVDSTQGYHGVMNLLLMPMWLLSGALFPLSGAPGWLAAVMRANPLTYGVAALRRALQPEVAALLPGRALALGVLAAFAAVGLAASLGVVLGRRRGRA